jgi:hypothetical protein
MSHAGLESWVPGFFAAFLSADAKAGAHWYTVKSLSEGVSSLAELLGVSNGNLDQLLSLSGFGCTHFSRYEGSLRANISSGLALSICRKCPSLEPLDLDLARVHNLRSLQTFINSIASKSTIFDGGGASQNQSSHTAATTSVKDKCVPDPPTATDLDLTLLRMKTNLLLLLLKQDLLDLDALWSPVGDSSKSHQSYWTLQKISNSRKKTSCQRYWGPSEHQFTTKQTKPKKEPNAEAIWHFPGRQKSPSISSV